jgi:glycosyltransferase involved in cell wall biosynthesis
VADQWQPLLKKSKVQVIHNGIPYDNFLADFPSAKKELGLPEDQVIVGMIARINPWKGQLFFLEIAEKIAANNPKTHFVFVGDPFPGYEPILEELLKKVKDKNLENQVTYLGFREDIPRVMNALDIFVLPSILPDPFPTVILEAMASSKPVVATYPGGSAEMVVDGKTGFLIPMGNVDLGALVLEKLIKNPEIRMEFGKAGRARVLSEFSLKAFEEKIKHFYGKI